MRTDYILKQFNKFSIGFEANTIHIKGPFATNLFEFPRNIIQLSEKSYFFKTKSELLLFRTLILNTINRSIQPHFKKITLKGIGFKCYKITSRIILFKIGFTHKIYYIAASSNINIICKKGRLLVYGDDISAVNNLAHEVKNLRKPDSYKGKGVTFTDEKLRLKSSKKRT